MDAGRIVLSGNWRKTDVRGVRRLSESVLPTFRRGRAAVRRRDPVRRATEFEGEPLVGPPYPADYSRMNSIGAISMLATSAAQPFAAGPAPSVDASSGATGDSVGTSGAAVGRPSAALAGDYAMSVLSKITHASADQALALIQGMLAPTR